MSRVAHAPHRVTAAALGLAAVLAATACRGLDDVSTPTADVPDTAALGVLPEPLTDSPTLPPPPPAPTGEVAGTTVPATAGGPVAPPFADSLEGDRLLFIGDGTLASAAPDNDQMLCDALSVFGWQAEIDAFEAPADLSYVSAVLDLRLRPEADLDWDAVVLWVANEVPPLGLAPDDLAAVLDETAERIAPRLLIVYTLTETDTARADLNTTIREVAARHPNVGVVDFAEQAGAASEVLLDDGVSLASDGLKRLPLITASAFGEAPIGLDGGCLEPGVDTGRDD
jgi:hypothetical protein